MPHFCLCYISKLIPTVTVIEFNDFGDLTTGIFLVTV